MADEKEKDWYKVAPGPYLASLLEMANRPTPYDLGIGRFAWILVTAEQQEDATSGDRLCATAYVLLPAVQRSPTDSCTRLEEGIQFGARLLLLGERLHGMWGSDVSKLLRSLGFDGSAWRYARKEEHGATWREAYIRAAHYALGELTRLRAMVAERRRAFESEGYELALAWELLKKTEPNLYEDAVRNPVRNQYLENNHERSERADGRPGAGGAADRSGGAGGQGREQCQGPSCVE